MENTFDFLTQTFEFEMPAEKEEAKRVVPKMRQQATITNVEAAQSVRMLENPDGDVVGYLDIKVDLQFNGSPDDETGSPVNAFFKKEEFTLKHKIGIQMTADNKPSTATLVSKKTGNEYKANIGYSQLYKACKTTPAESQLLDLVGSTVVVTVGPDVNYKTGEATGYAAVTGLYPVK